MRMLLVQVPCFSNLDCWFWWASLQIKKKSPESLFLSMATSRHPRIEQAMVIWEVFIVERGACQINGVEHHATRHLSTGCTKFVISQSHTITHPQNNFRRISFSLFKNQNNITNKKGTLLTPEKKKKMVRNFISFILQVLHMITIKKKKKNL